MSLNYENVGKNVIYNRSVDNIEDYVKGTIVGCYIGTDEEYYITSIESSGECIKVYDDSLIEIIEGDSVTPQEIVDATSQMTDEQAADTLQNIGAEPEKFVITVTYDFVNHEYTADKTFAEIVAAYNAGKTLMLSDGETGKVYVNFEGDDSGFAFAYVTSFLDAIYVDTYTVDDTEFWEYSSVKSSPRIVPVAGYTPTITPAANTIYECGEVTSLTVSSFPASGDFIISFTSGATATTTSFPVSMKFPEAFAPEANTRYEINVSNGYALAVGWPTT